MSEQVEVVLSNLKKTESEFQINLNEIKEILDHFNIIIKFILLTERFTIIQRFGIRSKSMLQLWKVEIW